MGTGSGCTGARLRLRAVRSSVPTGRLRGVQLRCSWRVHQMRVTWVGSQGRFGGSGTLCVRGFARSPGSQSLVFRTERYPRPWRLAGPKPPLRIETHRLVLRCWDAADARLFMFALQANRQHIGACISPVWEEPSELADAARRLEQFQAEFDAGLGFVFAILDSTETQVLGEAGLMPRLVPGTLLALPHPSTARSRGPNSALWRPTESACPPSGGRRRPSPAAARR